MSKLKSYYRLMKPGVMYGNVLTGVAGFLLASAGDVNWLLLVITTIGLTAVVGGACALNNYLDRDIDSKMARTKKRPSVTGEVSPRGMLVFSIGITIVGLAILFAWTNWRVGIVGIVGFVTYVWLYGAWSKRKSVHGTLVGSISGAMPILGGYVAASQSFDGGALIVFLILFFWQFPEFYSISIYRRKEYAAAHVPVISVARGVESAKKQIIIYTVLYVLATLALTIFHYTGWIYFIIMLLVGLYWIYLSSGAHRAKNIETWARGMFRFSMYTILILVIMLSIGPVLP